MNDPVGQPEPGHAERLARRRRRIAVMLLTGVVTLMGVLLLGPVALAVSPGDDAPGDPPASPAVPAQEQQGFLEMTTGEPAAEEPADVPAPGADEPRKVAAQAQAQPAEAQPVAPPASAPAPAGKEGQPGRDPAPLLLAPPPGEKAGRPTGELGPGDDGDGDSDGSDESDGSDGSGQAAATVGVVPPAAGGVALLGQVIGQKPVEEPSERAGPAGHEMGGGGGRGRGGETTSPLKAPPNEMPSLAPPRRDPLTGNPVLDGSSDARDRYRAMIDAARVAASTHFGSAAEDAGQGDLIAMSRFWLSARAQCVSDEDIGRLVTAARISAGQSRFNLSPVMPPEAAARVSIDKAIDERIRVERAAKSLEHSPPELYDEIQDHVDQANVRYWAAVRLVEQVADGPLAAAPPEAQGRARAELAGSAEKFERNRSTSCALEVCDVDSQQLWLEVARAQAHARLAGVPLAAVKRAVDAGKARAWSGPMRQYLGEDNAVLQEFLDLPSATAQGAQGSQAATRARAVDRLIQTRFAVRMAQQLVDDHQSGEREQAYARKLLAAARAAYEHTLRFEAPASLSLDEVHAVEAVANSQAEARIDGIRVSQVATSSPAGDLARFGLGRDVGVTGGRDSSAAHPSRLVVLGG